MSPSPLSARRFFRDPIGFVRRQEDDAGVLSLAAGPSRFVLVRDPGEIWRVLVSDADAFRQGKWKRRASRFHGETLNTLDGNEHRRRRLLLQPSLDRRRIARFGPELVARAEQMQAGWQDGARLRLRPELDRLSLTIAGDVLLSTDLAEISAELADALATVAAAVPRLAPPLAGGRRARALATVERAVSGVVSERRRSPGSEDDLVGALLESGLPDQAVRGELVAFLLAAADEPPSALASVWYLLARNPPAEERFHAELDAVLEDRPATIDEARLPYLGAVVREALRLYPPARHIDRCPVDDLQIDGVRVPAGANVLVSPLVTQREPSLYDHPSEFLPDRWLDGSGRDRDRGAYLPFGAGPHTCIGEPLARAIVTVTLATVGRCWRLRVEPDAAAPVPGAPSLFVTLERR